jgi:hypothetical protein
MGTILIDPHPRKRAVLFSETDWARMERLSHKLLMHEEAGAHA